MRNQVLQAVSYNSSVCNPEFYFILYIHRVIKKSLCTWTKSPHNWWVEDGHDTVHSECGPCYTEHGILSSITNKMQRYAVFFIAANAVHVSDGFSAHHQELKNCTHSIWYMSSFLAAVAASKLDIYQMLCVQFLSSWWWAEKSPETCRALAAVKNIV